MSGHATYEEMLAEHLKDPAFREEWERSAYARAIANQVIRYRSEHGLSQTALARKLGVSQAVVGRLELGEHEPKISTLQRLSEKLGLRFIVDIHPAGTGAGSFKGHTERVVTSGVETLVSAG